MVSPAPDRPTPLSRWASGCAALLLSLGMAVRALWPILVEPRAWLVGDWSHPDNLSNHWLLAWVAEQASGGGSLLHNDRYYWPVGDAPLLAGNGAEGFLYLPFHLALGWPDAVGPYLIMILTLGGFSAWVLARAAGAAPAPALIAVGFFSASPFVFQELAAGRFSQADVGWLLLFLAAWLHLLRNPRVVAGVIAGAALAATGFFYWYYAWFGAVAAAMLWIARGPRTVGWRPIAAAVGTACLLLGPWLLLHLLHWSSIPGTDEAAFPHPESRLDVATATLAVMVERGREAGRALPWTLWGASVVGGQALARAAVRPGPGRPKRWLAGGLLLTWASFLALSFGPVFAGAPYTLVYGMAGVLRRFWWPLRHTVVVNAMLAVMAAVGLGLVVRWLAGRLKRPQHAPLAAAVIAVGATVTAPQLLDARQLPSRVMASAMVLPPKGYVALGALPDGVLVEPPLSPSAAGTQQHLIYQRWHGKTLLSGHALWVDRVRPDAWDDVVAGNSLLANMQRLEQGLLDDGVFEVEAADIDRLRSGGVRWFGLNREHLPLAMRPLRLSYDALFTSLFGEPVVRGKGLRIWDAENWTGVTRVQLDPTPWPASLQRAPTDRPLVARRPESPVFPIARPTGPHGPPPGGR